MMLLSTSSLLRKAPPTLTNHALRSFASVGDMLPSVELHHGFPPKKHNLATFAKDKSILLVGLPGAFTPT
jgi:hypothetical protein